MSTDADPGNGTLGQPGPAPGADSSEQVALSDPISPGSGAIALRAVNPTLSFGQRTILKDVDLDVRRGVMTALLGPTGTGKTSLLRTFNWMNDKVTGYRHDWDVLLDGSSVLPVSPA